ncbi:MAG: AraC family transcriptional regulator [Clostridiales bacterium]|jgi:AraC family transcriptional regulator|nr:AraC family transcriptional regulator [Clostridiales bacterium]
MDWIERLNLSLEYIEQNLTEKPDYEKIARIACCSAYHFQRMFAYLAGVPLGEYIRRRRMTLAAAELQTGDAKVIDLALKYGYDSPTAFNRAFQGVHGIAPSAARERGVSLQAFLPISFKIMVKGAAQMEYRIEQKESFRIVGLSAPLKENLEENFQVVPQLWAKAAQEGVMPKLAAMMDTPIKGVLGVSACMGKDWYYYIAAASTLPLADTGFVEYTVPACTWAVFPGTGSMPGSIQTLEQRIVTEWLPTSGYEYADAPDVELYLTPDPQNATFEVWVPVVKK